MRVSPFKLMCSAGLFAIFSSTLSKSLVLPLFASHLGATASGVGVVAAISTLAGIAFSIPAGLLSDRFGRKTMLMAVVAAYLGYQAAFVGAAIVLVVSMVAFFLTTFNKLNPCRIGEQF